MQLKHQQLFICVSLLILCVLIIWSCYPTRVGPIGPDRKQLTWDEMNIDQRKTHMESFVLPPAAELFRAWQPKRFDDVSCNLCHDTGTATENFHMPTSHLPRLSGDWTLSHEFEKYPDTTKLKLDRLIPLMSEALGKKSFSVITRRGFGCYSCHLGPSGPMFGH
jgi:hypothetical protein